MLFEESYKLVPTDGSARFFHLFCLFLLFYSLSGVMAQGQLWFMEVSLFLVLLAGNINNDNNNNELN